MCLRFISIWILIMVLLKTWKARSAFLYQRATFEQILFNETFIDKSEFIEKVLEEPSTTLLFTAARRFGKTVNMDMLKRFIEIEVNDKSNQRTNLTVKSNWKLFNDNRLKVLKNETLVKKHFGKYPVLHIQFEPLRKTRSFANMGKLFRNVTLNCYSQHQYLLENKELWRNESEKRMFINRMRWDTMKKQPPASLKRSLFNLLRYMYLHFKKQIFVLMDDYDVYYENLLFNATAEAKRIVDFLQPITDEILFRNSFVLRSVLMGTLKIDCGHNITHYGFLKTHRYTSYFGMTRRELNKKLNDICLDSWNYRKSKQRINPWYGGYLVPGKRTKIFSICSLSKFLATDFLSKRFLSVWVTTPQFDRFASRYLVNETLTEMKTLARTVGGVIVANISDRLSQELVLKINGSKSFEEERSLVVEHYWSIIYNMGFLSVVNKSDPIDGPVRLKTPNRETSVFMNLFYFTQYFGQKKMENALNQV